MAETTTIYVVKGAETHGIRTYEVELQDGGKHAMEPMENGKGIWQRKSFWHTEFKLTLPEAVAEAEKRRQRKITSLEKQIAAMRTIDLTSPANGPPSSTTPSA